MAKLSIIYDSIPTFQGEVTKLDITEYNQTIEINYRYNNIDYSLSVPKNTNKYSIMIIL